MARIIVGCGDVGRRIAKQLLTAGESQEKIIAFNASAAGNQACTSFGITARLLNLDESHTLPVILSGSELFYLVPPQPHGEQDLRSANLLASMIQSELYPRKVVLISTTGVYGDCHGQWVTEESLVKPSSARAKRRLDSEQQWRAFCEKHKIALMILRVPGIYSNSRIPVERIRRCSPIVRPDECGFTNRIHAEDLAAMSIAAMQSESASDTASVSTTGKSIEVYNCSDGIPSNMSEYLQEAARVSELAALPEISMREAQELLSPGMLSYLAESRKISNRKILDQLKVTLLYPDFRVGLRH